MDGDPAYDRAQQQRQQMRDYNNQQRWNSANTELQRSYERAQENARQESMRRTTNTSPTTTNPGLNAGKSNPASRPEPGQKLDEPAIREQLRRQYLLQTRFETAIKSDDVDE
ncbi:MAG TPA: hypothetical protein PLG78_07960, partial [Leptospiraceae bacterium]|nr:hypothetical protein [Leptospiraceae bacterium]